METFTPGPRPTSRIQLAEWYTAILNEQERSGLSMAQFAQEIGAHVVTLYAWRRRLASPTALVSKQEHGLVHVKIAEAPATTSSSGTFVLRLGNEPSLEIPPNFITADLVRIVQALDAC